MPAKYLVKPELISTVKLLSYSGLLPLFVLIGTNFSSLEFDALEALRLYGALLLSFLTGVVFFGGMVLNSDDASFDFNARGALWGSVLVFSACWGAWFLEGKVGLFLLPLLYLVLWQIEQKTSLARLYDQWFWVMRTQLTMIVAASYAFVWLTLPN